MVVNSCSCQGGLNFSSVAFGFSGSEYSCTLVIAFKKFLCEVLPNSIAAGKLLGSR